MCGNWDNKDEKVPTPQEVKSAGGSFLEWRLLDYLLLLNCGVPSRGLALLA